MKYEGSMYECDRCGAKEFLTADAPARADWIDVERVTVDGQNKKVLLCPACYVEYKELVTAQDREFNAYMAERSPKK